MMMILALGLMACSSQGEKKEEVAQDTVTNTAEIVEVILDVQGMTCEGCENAVKAGVGSLEGIEEVEASHVEAFTRIRFDKSVTSVEEISAKITETGYKVVGEKAAT
jgi:copper chaperone